ncbi:MAG: hypothetical protein JNL08_14395 [Planctomycetes bacterium]|nr:hypothetical protein [Planctomycetota bacterium]
MNALRDCRMVLAVADAGAAELRAIGVPTVTLAAGSAADCRRLHHFRHRFDGIVVDLDRLAGASAQVLWPALDEALLPGGRLLLRGATPAGLPGPTVATADGLLWRKPGADLPAPPPMVRVGPYADLFTGCRRVVELGAGGGAFLDALRLRGVATAGIEATPGLAAAARARGHDVVAGGLAQLPALAGDCDGVYAHGWLDDLDPATAAAVLAAVHHALPTGARCVVRGRGSAIERLRRSFVGSAWQPVRAGRVQHDADDAFVVALAAGPRAAWPHGIEALAIDSARQPLQQPPRSFFDLERAERQVTSQGGEDGVLAELFARLGTTNRCYVEFGCGDGLQCNTTQLRRSGWHGLLMDGMAAPAAADAVIHAAWITAENINELLDQHGVPDEPDLLSIDVDGNDWWIWRAIRRRPRVVVCEYNANLPFDRALTMPYDPAHRWDGSDFYGASLLALAELGRRKGYTLVYCTQAGVNAFFVRDDQLPPGTEPVDPRALWRPPNYWYRGYRSPPDLGRALCTL